MTTTALNTGISALQASQVALQVVSNNIANAGTEGYHRQQVRFVDREPDLTSTLAIGRGVDVSRIVRLRDGIIEQSLTTNLSGQADAATRLATLQRLESLFTPGVGGLQSRLQSLFDNLYAISSRPDDSALRQQAIVAGRNLTDEINALAEEMSRLRQLLDSEIRTAVENTNALSSQIADLNKQIEIAVGRGLEPHDLRDRRDQLLNELAQFVDVRTWEWAGQPDAAAFGSGAVLLTATSVSISIASAGDDGVQLQSDQSGRPLVLTGGRLAGLLAARNELVPEFEGRLTELATTLVRAVDQVQATGLGLDGPYTRIDSARPVNDVSAALNDAGIAFPVGASELFINVTDLGTGARRIESISIDPAVDSLADIAARLDALDRLHAVVDPLSGKLTVMADPGYAFDFAARLETAPDRTAVTGTADIRFDGRYNGSSNDEFQFTVIGSGQVGVMPGLQVEVRDAAGTLLATLNVGPGYEPGTLLNAGRGVRVSFGVGTLNAADAFGTPLVANSDSGGLLSALGILSFFSGTKPGTLGVNSALLANSSLLSVSVTGSPGDASNLARFAAVRDQKLLPGALTLEEFAAETTTMAGLHVQQLDTALLQFDSQQESLEAARANISGVDPNEEMVRLLQFQRGFQAAAKLIKIVDETLQELMGMVG